jgi:single-strand DNA-binding protein
MNVFTGIGRLGRDAEIRYSADGKPITTFAVAIEDGFGDRKTTSWIDCALFGDRGPKIAEYIRKGDRIGITGPIRLDTYKTNSGEERSKIAMRVQDVTLLGDKRDDAAPARSGGTSARPPRETPRKAQEQASAPADNFEDDEIPFVSNRSTW